MTRSLVAPSGPIRIHPVLAAPRSPSPRWRLLALSSTVFFLGLGAPGCRGRGEVKVTDEFFFPVPPELPRLQYLRSFNGSIDFEERRPLLDYLAGSPDTMEYELQKPFSVATWKGKIYVTDSFGLQALAVFDLEARRFYVLGKTPGRGALRKPISVTTDEEGYKYVSDLERRQVVVYGPDDDYARTYGDGRSFLPVACAVHGGEVYVLDAMKDRVKPEDPDADWEEVRRDQILVLEKETGKPLRRIGRHGAGVEGFSFASFLTVDREGNLYVSDFLNYRVVKLDPQGNVLRAFGRHGDRAGDFAQMKGIAVDPQGLIYVVDAAFAAVQVFDNAGLPLFPFGGPRAPRGAMDLPAGIWVDHHNLEYFRDDLEPDFDAEYLVLVANQLSPRHKITVYAYGKRRGLEYPSGADLATLGGEKRRSRPLWRLPVLPPEPPASEEPGPTPLKRAGAP